jgi:hypothetical protein
VYIGVALRWKFFFSMGSFYCNRTCSCPDNSISSAHMFHFCRSKAKTRWILLKIHINQQMKASMPGCWDGLKVHRVLHNRWRCTSFNCFLLGSYACCTFSCTNYISIILCLTVLDHGNPHGFRRCFETTCWLYTTKWGSYKQMYSLCMLHMPIFKF